MKSARMYSFAKNELSISSKELIKNVLYSVENGVLKNFTNFTGNTCVESLFYKVADLFGPANLFKRYFNTYVFL